VANRVLVTDVIKCFPPTEGSNAWRDDILVADDPECDRQGVRHSIDVTKSTLWKHDIMIRHKGQLNEERALMPGGHPLWIVGQRAKGVEAGTKEVLLAKLVVERGTNARFRHNVRLLVVRVAADAYDAARRWNDEELEVAYEVRYPEAFDAERMVIRVTGESPGAVGIYSFRHLRLGRDLRQRAPDKESRRLPVDKVADIRELADSDMELFGVQQHLQDVAGALGLQPTYEELTSRHAERWRRPTGAAP
jgi:hypothetical protein